MFILGSLESQRRRQLGTRGPAHWIKSAPPSARGLARHNKRFTIKEIIKIVAIRCQILRLKCIKSFVGRGSAPDRAEGAYSAPQTPNWILGTNSKGGSNERGKEGKGGEGRVEKGRKGKRQWERWGRVGMAPKLGLAWLGPQNYFPGAGAVESA